MGYPYTSFAIIEELSSDGIPDVALKNRSGVEK
jgi:hypothetical protein